MMKNPTVSVIVPCFKQAEYLPDALESVLAQTWEHWECIIVNDGSPDKTEVVANDYCSRDKRFRYVYQANGGLSSARNCGIRKSNGEFILPLDADDKISPKYIQKAVEVLDKDKSIKVVYCLAEYFGESTGIIDLDTYSFRQLLIKNMIFCSALFRRADFDKTRGYCQEMKGGYEDWDFWIELLKNGGDVYKIPRPYFFYRQKKTSMLLQVDLNLKLKLISRIIKNHQEVYDSHLPYFLVELANEKLYRNQLNEVLQSRSYKLARIISLPLRCLKNLCLPK